MPEASHFLSHFKVAEGDIYANYQLIKLNIEEHKVNWNEYSYAIHFTMKWKGKGKPNLEEAKSMLKKLYKHTRKVRIVDSESGRHYKCTFIYPRDSNFIIDLDALTAFKKIEFACVGYAQRISVAEMERIKSDGKW
jgi:hypothetical protein